MWYEETKIYHDGSHYIAIPHTTNPRPRRPRPKETEIEVVENDLVSYSNDDGNVRTAGFTHV